MAEIVIYQQNLHRSLVPTQELLFNSEFHTDQNTNRNSGIAEIKVLCVQEPNTRHKLASVFGSPVYETDDNNQRTRSAIITKYKNTLKLQQFCTPDLVLVNIIINTISLYIYVIYIVTLIWTTK